MLGALTVVLASCARMPTPEEANDAVLTLRAYESWAWAAGIALIWADVVLPVPQTAVIAALGIIYGTLLGGVLGSVGLISGGLLGYVLMLTAARRFVQRVTGRQSLHKMERVFEQGGAWAIVLTRSLPYSVPEVMVFLAGLAGMPIRKFTAALTIGGVPTGVRLCRHRRRLGRSADRGPRREFCPSHPVVAGGVLSHTASSTGRMPTLIVVLRTVALLALAGPLLLRISGRRADSRMRARQRGGDRAPVVANFAAFGVFFPSLLIFSGSSEGSATLWLAASGSLLAVAGGVLVLKSRTELGPAWSFVPRADQDTGLITTGPYRLVRHPIYLGLTLLAMGEALAFSSWSAVLIVLCGIVPTFVRRARAEETVLRGTFGESYARYQKHTKMIIPHIL